MIKISSLNARTWSKLGGRGTFGMAVIELVKENENIMVISADLAKSSGLDRFTAAYPERFVNAGIAEQDMIGIAAGLAKEGFTVFATSFAPFISMRSCEQIRINMGYMELNVKAVGIGSGLSMGYLGNSHYGLEDAAVMRAIPNITIVSPADGVEIVKTIFAAAEHKGPMYIRITGGPNNPIVYKEDYDFVIGKAIILHEGKDVAIIATGTMVYQSLEAAKVLEEQGITCKVVDMHTIKPLDFHAIQSCLSCKLIVTAEEHSIIGGLGSAIAESLAGLSQKPPQLIIGLSDEFKKAGEYQYMLEQYGLTAPQIAMKISQKLMEVKSHDKFRKVH